MLKIIYILPNRQLFITIKAQNMINDMIINAEFFYREENLMKELIENPKKENFEKFKQKVFAGKGSYSELCEYINQDNLLENSDKLKKQLEIEEYDKLVAMYHKFYFISLIKRMVGSFEIEAIIEDFEQEQNIIKNSIMEDESVDDSQISSNQFMIFSDNICNKIQQYYNEKYRGDESSGIDFNHPQMMFKTMFKNDTSDFEENDNILCF